MTWSWDSNRATIQGEQNDFALLNQLRDLPLVGTQLQLF